MWELGPHPWPWCESQGTRGTFSALGRPGLDTVLQLTKLLLCTGIAHRLRLRTFGPGLCLSRMQAVHVKVNSAV